MLGDLYRHDLMVRACVTGILFVFLLSSMVSHGDCVWTGCCVPLFFLTMLVVVFLLDVSEGEFSLFGHAYGECHLCDGPALVLLATRTGPRRLRREAHQKQKDFKCEEFKNCHTWHRKSEPSTIFCGYGAKSKLLSSDNDEGADQCRRPPRIFNNRHPV